MSEAAVYHTTPQMIRQAIDAMFEMDDYSLGGAVLELCRQAREAYAIVEPEQQISDAWPISALVWWAGPEIAARLIEKSGHDAQFLTGESHRSIRALKLQGKVSIRGLLDGVLMKTSPALALRTPCGITPDPFLLLCNDPSNGNPVAICLDRLAEPLPIRIVDGEPKYGYCGDMAYWACYDRRRPHSGSAKWAPKGHKAVTEDLAETPVA
jgi:hypothetical protein